MHATEVFGAHKMLAEDAAALPGRKLLEPPQEQL